MATREIQGHVRELCGLSAPPEPASKVTGAAHGEIRGRQARPLGGACAVACFDAVRAKVRDEGLAWSKAVCFGIGATRAGRKEAPGPWIEQTEGARFWLAAMSELGACGPQDAPVAVVDGLKGFLEVIEPAHPEAAAQACVARPIRRSLACASWKGRKALASELKAACQAPAEAPAASALDVFESGPWGQKHPGIARAWHSAWDRVAPFFAFSAPVRRAICATNAIEGLNSAVRQAPRRRAPCPVGLRPPCARRAAMAAVRHGDQPMPRCNGMNRLTGNGSAKGGPHM